MLRAFEVGVLFHQLYHDGADGKVLREVGKKPAAGGDFRLFEQELAAGIDFGEHEAERYGLEDVAFHAGEEVSAGIDPGAPLEASEGLRGHGGGVVGGVGLEVDHDFGNVRMLALGLPWDVAKEHGIRDLMDDLDCGLFAGGVAFDVLCVVFWGVEHVLQTLAFGRVLFRREGAAVTEDESGDGAVFRLDDVADLVTLGVADVHSIAQVRTSVLEDLELVRGGVSGPLARLEGEWILLGV